MATQTEDDPPVKALATGMDVLEELAAEEALGPTELADRLGYAKSSIHDHLRTLEQRGYADRNDDGSYSLSIQVLRLGHESRTWSHLYRSAVPKLERLADATDATTTLAVRCGTRAVCVEVVHGNDDSIAHRRPGGAYPLHCTATGKALLAASDRPGELIDRLELEEHTDRTITAVDELQDRLEAVRQRGLAMESEEFMAGIRGIARSLPSDDRRTAAIGVHTGAERLTGKQFHQDVPGQLIKTTKQIQNDLYVA